MTRVGGLVLVLGLLVSAHCAVRARDPEVEEEEEEERSGGRAGWDQQDTPESTLPPAGGGGNFPTRTGNWCAKVQQQVVTSVVTCGTEKFTIRSQSPCPTGDPGCPFIMYKLSTRPVYREQKKIHTALVWTCCPGHSGVNCEDSVAEGQVSDIHSALIGQSEPGGPTEHSGHDHVVHQELNDAHLQNPSDMHAAAEEHSSLHGTEHHTGNPPHGNHHPQNSNFRDMHAAAEEHSSLHGTEHHTSNPPHGNHHPQNSNFRDDQYPLSVPDVAALVMHQLHPVLDGFNRSLELLTRHVGALANDLAQMRSHQPGPHLEGDPFGLLNRDDSAQEDLGAKLEDTLENIAEVRRLLESQRVEMDQQLHSQHAMLHYNLTSFKRDVDSKLKRNGKMMQTSLQMMNATLADLRVNQEEMAKQLQRAWIGDHSAPPETPSPTLPPTTATHPSAVDPPQSPVDAWSLVKHLQNTTAINMVKLSALEEDLKENSHLIHGLQRGHVDLKERIAEKGRNSQIQFMETVLEVEAAKVAVLTQLGELAWNLSRMTQHVKEMDMDVDYLYTLAYRNQNQTGGCNCQELKDDIARLEQGLDNVTELANENAASDAGGSQWGEQRDWEAPVRSLQVSLQQVKDNLAQVQGRTRTLHHNVSALSSDLAGQTGQLLLLQASDGHLADEMRRVASSFKSLMNDVIRNNEVLEILLGQEVLDFLDWIPPEKEALAIPLLMEQMRSLQVELLRHNLSIAALLSSRKRDREESPAADQPSSPLLPWGRVGVPASREQQLLHASEPGHGGHLWKLEKSVEELGIKVRKLEHVSGSRAAPPSDTEDKLQAEVMWLRSGLQDHLRVFKNVFRNADVLENADRTLDLNTLWTLARDRHGKKKKGGEIRKRGQDGEGRGGTVRSRRDTRGSPGTAEGSLLLLATSPRNLHGNGGQLIFKTLVNPGRAYSETGSFTAPVGGVYLFVLTLEMRPGPAQVLLRRPSGEVMARFLEEGETAAGAVTRLSMLRLQEGEELTVGLTQGQLVGSNKNVLAVLQLR